MSKPIGQLLWQRRETAKPGKRAADTYEGWEIGFRVRHLGEAHILWIDGLKMMPDGVMAEESMPEGWASLSRGRKIAKAVAWAFFKERLHEDSVLRFNDKFGFDLRLEYEHLRDKLGLGDLVDKLVAPLLEAWKEPVHWYKDGHKARWYRKDQPMKKTQDTPQPPKPQGLDEIFGLNKRLLYEIKQLREQFSTQQQELQALKNQLAGFLAGIQAAGVSPAVRRSGQPAERPAQPQLDAAPDPDEIPNAPQQPQVAPGATKDIGLVARAKPAPGTRPQASVKRHKVAEITPGKSGVDIRNPSEYGDAMAFDDMMNGR